MGDVARQSSAPDARRPNTDADELIVDIVEAVAAARDADPTALDLRLGEEIDLDALASMYAHASDRENTWSMTFAVDGATVTVESDGRVTVS